MKVRTMPRRLPLVLLLALLMVTAVLAGKCKLSDEQIAAINGEGFWQAARDDSSDLISLPNRRGVIPSRLSDHARMQFPDDDDVNANQMPETYDARTAWANCSSIKVVHHQGDCHASWAVATVDALTDRVCIQSRGVRNNTTLSAQDLIGCCAQCADNGCDGGDPEMALDYWMNVGLVSGNGRFGERVGCRPYLYAADRERLARPECRQKCRRSYGVSFVNDRRFGRDAQRVPQDEKSIRKEIFDNGPVVASFVTHEALDCYQSGVYTERALDAQLLGEETGQHAVRLIGWGVDEDQMPYWLAVNSWGKVWGQKGLFKIARGVNSFGIESRVLAGFPEL